MKTNTVLIFMCLALVAQASWLDSLSKSAWFSHFVNHTRLRGKFDVNTDKGLKVDYNAKLGYENGKLALDLADVGANFNAERQNSSDLSNGKHGGAFNYTGAVVVNQNGHKANVTVDGVIEIHGDCNKSDGNNKSKGHHYGVHIKNANTWQANAAEFQVKGGHYGKLNVSGEIEKNGSLIKAHHKLHGFTLFSGNVTHDGENVGFGYAAKGGDAHIHSKIFLTGGKVAEIDYQGHHAKPDAISSGKAGYRGFTRFGWNNDSQGYTKEGKAEFEGIAWTKSHDKDNNTFRGFAAAKNIDYTHKGQIFTNGKKVADTLSVGDVAILKSGGVKVNEDGTWEKGFGSTGVLNQWTIGKLVGNHSEESFSPESEDDESEEFKIECILNKYTSNKTAQERCNKKKKMVDNNNGEFLAKFKANWAHHAVANGSKTDSNSTNIDFKTGTLYKFGGVDSISKKPWEHHGYRGVSGSYSVGSGDDAQPANLTIHF